MTEPDTGTTRSDADDWDHHWSSIGDNALGNPANDFRNRILLRHLGEPSPGSTVVDIGSGQGEFALLLQAGHPEAHVVGIEYSHEGVRRATQAARDAGLNASFVQRDLLEPPSGAPITNDPQGAELAVCTEVLEHVDQPEVLLQNASGYLKPGCRLVLTVPGGPRSAFDRYIGHRRHFDPTSVRVVLESAGFEVESIERAGFPFFNLYRLAVIARGKKLIADVETSPASSSASTLQRLATRFFEIVLRHNLDDSPFGWQLVAVARWPGEVTH